MEEKHLVSAFIGLRERLRTLSAGIIGSPDAADDALQDAFVKLWGRKYPLKSDEDAARLLRTTVRNISIDQVRSRKQTLDLRDIDVASPEPEDVRETYESVMRIMQTRLSETQLYILRRKEFDGVPIEKIAKELGMQPPAVRMQLSRARKTIREEYLL